MDGEADDFLIDGEGNLVPVDEEAWEPPAFVPGEIVAVAVVAQDGAGEASVQVYGTPTPDLMNGLFTMLQGIALALKAH